MNIFDSVAELFTNSGFATLDWQNWIMIAVACVLLFLGIAKQFEPLLLVGIAFGMLLTNIVSDKNAGDMLFHSDFWTGDKLLPGGKVNYALVLQEGGLIDILYIGVKTSVYPCLIFMGVGAMTDFGPMLSRPISLIMGAAAQFGIYAAFIFASTVLSKNAIGDAGFTLQEAASIGIIGGADGPTAIWLTKNLAPHLLGSIAIAAYSYMALIPLIQPPIIKLFTTKKERMIRMDNPKQVSKATKIVFPICVTIVTVLILPSVAGLLGCLMFGNLLKECGVTERLSDTAQNALMNIVTLFLGISVGATATASSFLTPQTLLIIVLGLAAFSFATAGGVLVGKLLCWITKGRINPMIGAAGVSAVPMAARVVHNVGREYDLDNHLLMHAMAPNVAGVIGSAVAAGLLMAFFG